MNVDLDTRLALDPEFCLRNDVDRAVLITRPQPLSKDKPHVARLLRPREAILLALMDGDRTVSEVGALWAELTTRDVERAADEVHAVILRYTTGELAKYGFLKKVDDANRASIRDYDPLTFATSAERVNLSDPRLRRPYLVYYLPTLFCPQRCIYCYAKTPPQMEHDLLPLERLREIFAELREIGVDVIQLSGGDPFARKDIFTILEAIYEAGMVTYVPTKLGLSRESAMRLKDLGIGLVQVSLDATEPEILDRMVGVKNYHSRIFRIFEDLRDVGLSVRVNTVLTPINAPYIGGLIDYLGALGNVMHVSLTPYGRSLFCHSDELFMSTEELSRVVEERRLRAGRYPHMEVTGGDPDRPGSTDPATKERLFHERAMCTANRQGFVILPDGRVTPCEELYDHPDYVMGDLRHQSVMEMWNSPKAVSLVHPDQNAVPEGPCRTCAEFAQCNLYPGRCWRDVLKAYGQDRAYYPDPRCPLAPPGNRLN